MHQIYRLDDIVCLMQSQNQRSSLCKQKVSWLLEMKSFDQIYCSFINQTSLFAHV